LHCCAHLGRILLRLALLRPLGKDPAAGVGEPVVDLVDGEPGLFDEHGLLVVVRVGVVLVLTKPVQHDSHRLGETGENRVIF